MTRLHRFAWLVLVWNMGVILWGAFVRATGSGAGCGEHWPLCNGEALPRAPSLETMIVYTHRATSGIALLLVLLLLVWVVSERPKGHPARRAAGAALALILSEAAVGAGLVLFRLVAENESAARALFMAVHLVNTFLLLAALALTAHWCGSDAPPRPDTLARDGRAFGVGFVGLVLVGVSGAVAALGDTLFPARSLFGGLTEDLSPATHVLVRLRLAHPLLALAGSLVVAFVAVRVLRGADDRGVRRAAWLPPALAVAQLATGFVNVALLAPVWMQIFHLLLADLLWISFVLLAARSLAAAPRTRAQLQPVAQAG